MAPKLMHELARLFPVAARKLLECKMNSTGMWYIIVLKLLVSMLFLLAIPNFILFNLRKFFIALVSVVPVAVALYDISMAH